MHVHVAGKCSTHYRMWWNELLPSKRPKKMGWIIILKQWPDNQLDFLGRFSPGRKKQFGVWIYKMQTVH